jgi:hypothetical protein
MSQDIDLRFEDMYATRARGSSRPGSAWLRDDDAARWLEARSWQAQIGRAYARPQPRPSAPASAAEPKAGRMASLKVTLAPAVAASPFLVAMMMAFYLVR